MSADQAGEYDGRVVVVTGGAAGIGAAITAEALRRGATVVALDLDPSTVADGATGLRMDVGDSASVAAAFEQIAAQHDHIDLLVNNAGIGAFGTVEAFDDTEWARVLNVNVAGAARVSAAAIVQVENFLYATSQEAQTTLRSILGQAHLGELLAERERLGVDCEHLIGGRHDRHPAASPVLSDEGCRCGAHPCDGG